MNKTIENLQSDFLHKSNEIKRFVSMFEKLIKQNELLEKTDLPNISFDIDFIHQFNSDSHIMPDTLDVIEEQLYSRNKMLIDYRKWYNDAVKNQNRIRLSNYFKSTNNGSNNYVSNNYSTTNYGTYYDYSAYNSTTNGYGVMTYGPINNYGTYNYGTNNNSSTFYYDVEAYKNDFEKRAEETRKAQDNLSTKEKEIEDILKDTKLEHEKITIIYDKMVPLLAELEAQLQNQCILFEKISNQTSSD
uniref:Uncharacterized protein n=1 Tax=Panagrolaimus sp. ES5 TaxID=591445 RepID=A0AC34FBJ8_9BILA